MAIVEDPMDLGRNDIEGALHLAEKAMKAGVWDADKFEFLTMLQDDPNELIQGLRALEGKLNEKR